jgi:FkbM family methyltransferase
LVQRQRVASGDGRPRSSISEAGEKIVGLKRNIRAWLVTHGYRVPSFLVRPHDRTFHEVVNATGPGMIVLDIGANRGDVAAAFAARGATVIALEPNSDIFPALEALAIRYPGIRPQMCAVLDEDTELKLYLHRDYDGGALDHSESSSLIADKPNVSAERYQTVAVRDIVKVIEEIGRPIDIVKIDAEGGEYRILTRMIESGVCRLVGKILVETHHDRIPSLRPEHERVLALIAEHGLADKIRLDWA